MGLGDEILAAGQARALKKKVKIGDGKKIIWNPLYDFIPYIDRDGEWFIDYPGHRGYYKKVVNERLIFNKKYRAKPAKIDLPAIENEYVIIEPRIKTGAPPGKYYPYFDEVVKACDCSFLQFNSNSLGVPFLKTDIIAAAKWIAGCRAYVGVEGFLHHLAAAFNKPAVVVFGAFSHPNITGYDFHKNIWIDKPDELGHRKKSGAMWEIDPSEVIQALDDCCRGQ